MLENLVDNALKHGPEGGAVRVLGAREGDRVTLAVEDDGPGIAPEHLPRLFERFYRVDPARSRERGCAGLGLAIASHLVESMSGAIAATSAPGKSPLIVRKCGAARFGQITDALLLDPQRVRMAS